MEPVIVLLCLQLTVNELTVDEDCCICLSLVDNDTLVGSGAVGLNCSRWQ